MTSREIFNEFRTGVLRRVYLLHGEEEYAKDRAVEMLMSRIDEAVRDFNVDLLDAPSADQVIETARTWPMMSEMRIVIVRNANFFGNSDKEAKTVIEFLASIPNCVTLAFVQRDSLDSRKALLKAISKAGAVVKFEKYSESEAARWAMTFAKRRNVEISPALSYKLVSMTGRYLSDIASECTKLCDYVEDGGTVKESDLDALVHANAEYTVFEMLEHFLAGRMEKALTLLDAALSNDDRDAAISLIGFFASRLRQMLRAREEMDKGRSDGQIIHVLGGNSYAAKKTIASARKFEKTQIQEAILLLAEADFAAKNSIESASDALSRVLVTVFAKNAV